MSRDMRKTFKEREEEIAMRTWGMGEEARERWKEHLQEHVTI